MEEERGIYCNTVGMRVKEGGETYGERRTGGGLASKEEWLIYDPKTSFLTPK